jgi:hypothetical protein
MVDMALLRQAGGVPSLGADRAELNDLFEMAVTNQLNDDNLLRALLPELPMVGNPYGVRFRIGRNASVGMKSEPSDGSFAATEANFGNQDRLRAAVLASIVQVGIQVTDYMVQSAAGEGGIDVVMEEIQDATMDFRDLEERQLFAIQAPNANIAGESLLNMVGLRHIIQDASPTPTDTDSLYGLLRTTYTVLFSNVQGNAGTPQAVTKAMLDKSIRDVFEDGGRGSLFVTKPEQLDSINDLFSSQQRFMNEVEIEAGFVVQTYRGIPIIVSINCSDTNAATLVNDSAGPGDIFLLDRRFIEKRVLKSPQMTQIAKDGPTGKWYIEAYEQLVARKPNSHAAIYDLN